MGAWAIALPVADSLQRAETGTSVREDGKPDSGELEAWMLAYQEADSNAARMLVQRLSPMLLRFFLGPLQTRGQAEDMVQECWLRVHKARHTYRTGAPVLPWIFAIARHTRVDTYRKRQRIESNERGVDDLSAGSFGKTDPDSDLGLDIWRLVADLPASQQEVVVMLKVTGMSLEEVARATGTTVGAVKQKAHRAYSKLRERLLEQSRAKDVK